MGAGLEHAVGEWDAGGMNLGRDVVIVQTLLEKAAAASGNQSYSPGEIDGKISRVPGKSATIRAIRGFQQRFMKSPDGVVEPSGKTLLELQKLAGAADLGLDNAMIAGLVRLIRTLERNIQIRGKEPAGAQVTQGQCFPLDFIPTPDYHKGEKGGARYFGAQRKVKDKKTKEFVGYRKHAGCDLIAPRAGVPVYAIDDGRIEEICNPFYLTSVAVSVRMKSDTVVRYCELDSRLPSGIRSGGDVTRGQVIGYVGQLKKDHMLHLEMYAGHLKGQLSNKGQKLTESFGEKTPYQRRTDIIDPTPFLDEWRKTLPKGK